MLFRLLSLTALILASTVTVAKLRGQGGATLATSGSPATSAPELDPSSLGSGLTLLAGGVMLLAERRRIRGQSRLQGDPFA
jgi:hypothetical protein